MGPGRLCPRRARAVCIRTGELLLFLTLPGKKDGSVRFSGGDAAGVPLFL